MALGDRVRLARAAKADLFISIHADSISAAPHVRGGTVYTGSERATDTESARLADRENKADAVGGVRADRQPRLRGGLADGPDGKMDDTVISRSRKDGGSHLALTSCTSF